MNENAVPGFRPSQHGLHFANRWPATPALWLGGRYLRLGIGNAADGLCGGMCFVVRDRFESSASVPPDRVPPAAGSPLFDEIVRRQVDSFDRLVVLPLRFWALAALHPARPTGWSRALGLRSRPAIAVRDEWPRIRAAIDAGRLPMVGLLRSASPNPLRLGLNHQVMAWGYRVAPGCVRILVYDPNWPDHDDVELVVMIGGGSSEAGRPPVIFTQSTGEPLTGFFEAPWVPPRG